MRVLQYITPSHIGGAEIHLLRLAVALRERGHYVKVVCPAGRPLIGPLRSHGLPLLAPRTTGKLDPLTLWRVGRLLRDERFDLLHTHLSTASLLGSSAAHRAGRPAVATVHGFNTATCYRFADQLIAVSAAVRDHLVGQGVPAARIEVIHHGVPEEMLTRPPAGEAFRRSLDLPPGASLVAAVGRLSPEKGQQDLILAAAHLPADVHVVIAGSGAARPRLAALARSLGVASRLRLIGYVADILPVLDAADLVAVPSRREALSLAALEAMARGRPVVASRTGGLPEVIRDGETGLLVPPADPVALAGAIARLLADPPLRAALGRAGRRRVEADFRFAVMLDRVESLYRRLAG